MTVSIESDIFRHCKSKGMIESFEGSRKEVSAAFRALSLTFG